MYSESVSEYSFITLNGHQQPLNDSCMTKYVNYLKIEPACISNFETGSKAIQPCNPIFTIKHSEITRR